MYSWLMCKSIFSYYRFIKLNWKSCCIRYNFWCLGTLKKGDFFVSGLKWGKVRAIINDKSQNISEAPPSTPVEVLGINGAAKAGDDFIVLDTEKEAKTLSENRAQESKDGKNPLTFATQDSAFSDKSSEELNLIIKSDVQGSSEAIN